MKTSTLTLALASLVVSASAFAHEINAPRESSLQTQKFHVAGAPSTPNRDAKKAPLALDAAKRGKTSTAQPDPDFMPYVNGGHYDSK